MAIYTVHLPESGNVEKARFIREGASFLALVLPAVWLIWHRLWLALIAYIAVSTAILSAVTLTGQATAGILSLIPGLFLFVEGNQFIRRKLERTGWRFAGVVDAPSAVDAEIRYFGQPGRSDAGNLRHRQTAPAARAVPAPAASPSFIGMFPE